MSQLDSTCQWRMSFRWKFSVRIMLKKKRPCLAWGLVGAAEAAGRALGLRCASGCVDGAEATSTFPRRDLEQKLAGGWGS